MPSRTFLNRFVFQAFGAAVLLAAPSVRGDLLYNWSASSGQFPNQVATSTGFAPVTLTESASPEDPALVGGALQLSTDQYVENMYYSVPLVANGNEASLGQFPLSIEFTLKVGVSGRSDTRRAGVTVAFVDGGAGNALQISDSEFFISNATFRGGPESAKRRPTPFIPTASTLVVSRRVRLTRCISIMPCNSREVIIRPLPTTAPRMVPSRCISARRVRLPLAARNSSPSGFRRCRSLRPGYGWVRRRWRQSAAGGF